MSFTDDDLKRLKEWVLNNDPREPRAVGFESGKFKISYDELKALLARLDAAETCLEESYRNLDGGLQYEHIDVLYEAWRKACGRDK